MAVDAASFAILKWGSSLVAGALGDIVKDRIKDKYKTKTKSAKARANEKVKRLYDSLLNVDKLTDKFVEDLHEISSYDIRNLRYLEENKGALYDMGLGFSASDLLYALSEMSSAIDDIDTQLSIYENEFLINTREFIVTRVGIITIVIRGIVESEAQSKQLINSLISQAEANQKIIKKSIEDFRKFLRDNFTFTDLFET